MLVVLTDIIKTSCMIINNMVMKIGFRILVLFALLCILYSCSMPQKIVVKGAPGTVIKDPRHNILGTIDNSSSITLTLPGDTYYAYLLSKAPGTETYIPFALDYKTTHNPLPSMARGATMGVAFGGCALAIVGLPMIAISGEGIVTASGLLAALAGSLGGFGVESYMANAPIKYSYEYTSQQTNNDLFDGQMTQEAISNQTTSSFSLQLDNTEVDGQMYKVISQSRLNVRRLPSADSHVLGTLQPSEQIEVLSTEGQWAKIKYKSSMGYVALKYIKKLDANSIPIPQVLDVSSNQNGYPIYVKFKTSGMGENVDNGEISQGEIGNGTMVLYEDKVLFEGMALGCYAEIQGWKYFSSDDDDMPIVIRINRSLNTAYLMMEDEEGELWETGAVLTKITEEEFAISEKKRQEEFLERILIKAKK